MLNFFDLFLFPFFGALKTESYPKKLTDEEEKVYLKLMKQGCSDSRGKLIEHNLRLVAHICKKYDLKNVEKDDLLSIGILGLIKGVDNFNVDTNNKLSTYVARCIENEILMYIRSNKKSKNNISLSKAIGNDKDGNEIELLEIVKDPKQSVEQLLIEGELMQNLTTSLSILNDKELDIIRRRYGLNGYRQMTQKEISEMLNISRSYVSRIEKRALMKLYLYIVEQ